MVAWTLAKFFLQKFGGDCIEETKENYRTHSKLLDGQNNFSRNKTSGLPHSGGYAKNLEVCINKVSLPNRQHCGINKFILAVKVFS